MGLMTLELQVPLNLRINNLSLIMNELLGNLSNLKVGTSGFKAVEGILTRIRNEMDKLEVLTSKPFVNLRLFVQAERSIDKIENGLSLAQIIMSRIKFSDLALTSELTNQIKQFSDEINKIRNNIKNVKEITKQNFFGTDIGKAWLGIDPNAVNQSLTLITSAITTAFNKQKKVVKEAEDRLKEYENALSLKDKINNFTTLLNSVNTVKSSRSIFEGIYDLIFNALGKFLSGGLTILAHWLAELFQLDETQVSSLILGTASKVIASLKSGELLGLIASKLNTVQQNTPAGRGVELKLQLDDATKLMLILDPIFQGVANSQLNATEVSKKFEQELERTIHNLDEYKNALAAAVSGNQNFRKAISRGKETLLQFKEQLLATETNFLSLERTLRNFLSIKMLITNFMGFTQVLNLVKRGVREALSHIKELDSVMNKIAIVTDMTTSDLWALIDAYSKMSQKYGVSIKGAYEVSQIYYQQGLLTKDVLTLTNETLKLSKISGLDYALTTDYMTTALRGFKMEMSDAATVVDVYSNLAAHTAVSQEELAVAMSKTASSLESVGSSFEEGSAMIGTMVAVTRESATNIGSAMKSIAARYGEMKSNPKAITDIEGEAIAYNKVDAALLSVGISLKDTDGQFRNFTDVIIELGEKWDTLESTQQRYIATQFAGNRQQSRFLALISNIDLLKENLKYAEQSENVGDIQALKALDSIETKIELVKVAYQEMYTTIGIQDLWKGVLDSTRNFMNTLNNLPKLFNTIPLGAIAMIADIIKIIKDLGFAALRGVSDVWALLIPDKFGANQGKQIGDEIAKGIIESLEDAKKEIEAAGKDATNSAAKGAADTLKDLNTPAGKELIPTLSKTVETVLTVTTEEIAKTESMTAAATNTANAMLNAAESGKDLTTSTTEVTTEIETVASAATDVANAMSDADAKAKDIVISAELIAASLSKDIYFGNFGAFMTNRNVDISNSEQVLLNFNNLFLYAALNIDSTEELFNSAGLDAIAAYAQGILTNMGISKEAALTAALEAAASFKLSQVFDDYFDEDMLDGLAPEAIIADIKNWPDSILRLVEGPLASLGDDLAVSIAKGILEKNGLVESAATSLASSIITTLRTTLNMHSPSPTIIAMFKNGVGDAIALGLKTSGDVVLSAAKKLGLEVSDGLLEALLNSKKINLSDYFAEGDAHNLLLQTVRDTRRILLDELDLISNKRLKASFAMEPKDVIRALESKEDQLELLLANLSNVLARINNILYEKIPIDYVVASHNFGAGHIQGMTDWGGLFPSPSIAVKGIRDRIWSDFGDATGITTAFMPRQYADPSLGHTNLYPGDAYTPVLRAGKQYPDIQAARKDLDSLPDIGFDFDREMGGVIRDATHIFNLSQLRKILLNSADLPFKSFGTGKNGEEEAYRNTITRREQFMDQEDDMLQYMLEKYVRTDLKIPRYQGNERMLGAMSTGNEAFGKAIYKAVDDMRLSESRGIAMTPEMEKSHLATLLTDILSKDAKISLPSKFEDDTGRIIVNSILRYINVLEKNPGYDWAEAKSRENIPFKSLAGLLGPSSLDFGTLENAMSAGLNPKTTFLYDRSTPDGPLGHAAMAKYMINNVPGVAFNENGPLVAEMPDISMNYNRLWETLNSQLVNSNISESLMDSIGSIMQGNLGQVFANTITAGLSNIDLSSDGSAAQALIEELIRSLATTMRGGVPELLNASLDTVRLIVAGMVIGLSSDAADATDAARGIGQSIINALNAGAGVASPSVFAILSGKFIMLGLEEGLTQALKDALAAAQKAGEAVVVTMDDALAKTPEGLNQLKEAFLSLINSIAGLAPLAKEAMTKVAEGLTLDGMFVQSIMESNKSPLEKINALELKKHEELDALNKSRKGIRYFKLDEKYRGVINPSEEAFVRVALGRAMASLPSMANLKGKELKAAEINEREVLNKARKEGITDYANFISARGQYNLERGAIVKKYNPYIEQLKENKRIEDDLDIAWGRHLEGQSSSIDWEKIEKAEARDSAISDEEAKKIAQLQEESEEATRDYLEGRMPQADLPATTNTLTMTVRVLENAKEEVAAKVEEIATEVNEESKLKPIEVPAEALEEKTESVQLKILPSETELVLPKADEAAAEEVGTKTGDIINEKMVEEASEPIPAPPIEGAKERAVEAQEEAAKEVEKTMAAELHPSNTDNLPKVSSPEAAPLESSTPTTTDDKEKELPSEVSEPILNAALESTEAINTMVNSAEEGLNLVSEAAENTGENINDGLSKVNTEKIIESISTLIDKLVETGHISESTGNQYKEMLTKMSPEELIAKLAELTEKLQLTGETVEKTKSKFSGLDLSSLGSAVRMLGGIAGASDLAKGAITALGGAITLAGTATKIFEAISTHAWKTMPWMAIVMGVMGIINGLSLLIETEAEKLERLSKEAEELGNKAKLAKANATELLSLLDKYKELELKRYDSAEATDEFNASAAELAEKFPALIKGFDEAGEAIIDANKMEELLTDARKLAAKAAYDAAKAELDKLKLEKKNKIKEAASSMDNVSVKDYAAEIGSKANVVEAYNKTTLWGSMWGQRYEGTGTSLLGSLNSSFDAGENPLEIVAWLLGTAAAQDTYGYNDNVEKIEELLSNIVDVDAIRNNNYASAEWSLIYQKLGNLKENYEADNNSYWSEEAELLYQFMTELLLTYDDLKITNNPNSLHGLLERSTEITNETLKKRLTEENNDDITIINEAISAYNEVVTNENSSTEEIADAYEYLKTVMNEVEQTSGAKYLKLDIDRINKALATTGTAIDALNGITDKIESALETMVSQWFDTQYSMQTFIRKNSGLKSIINDSILKEFGDRPVDELDSWLRTEGKQFANRLVESAESFWIKLSDSDQELFTKMLKDTGNYSFNDFVEIFGITPNSPIYKALEEYYEGSEEAIQERLLGKLNEDTSQGLFKKNAELWMIRSKFESLSRLASTVSQERYLNNVLTEFENLMLHGYTTMATNYANSALTLFDLINSLTPQARTAALNAISTNNITTKEGITGAIDAVQASEIIPEEYKQTLINQLTEVKNNILNNIGLSILTSIDQYLLNWQDASSTLTSLSSGIKLLDVESIIASEAGKSAKIGFDDFITDGNKLVMKASKANDYITAYFAKLRDNMIELLTALDNALGTWALKDELNGLTGTTIREGTVFNESGMEQVEAILGAGELGKYATQKKDGNWYVNSAKDAKKLNDALIKAYADNKEKLKNYDDILKWSEEQINKTIQWNQGNYSSLKEALKIDDTETRDELDSKLKELALYGADLSAYVDTPDVKNAITKINSSLSNFLSDILSKGINNVDFTKIDFSEYEGLPAWAIEELKASTFNTNYDFIKTYVKYTGKTLQESNALIMEALNKDNAKTSNEAISSLKFVNGNQFTATSKVLLEFADTFDLNLSSLIDQGIAYYDKALGEYVVNYTKISGLDLSKVEGFNETVQDSINKLFEELANLVKDGIDGALSYMDKRALEAQARQYGINNLQFVKTNGGWELVEESADRLLAAMHTQNASIAEMNDIVVALLSKKFKQFTEKDIENLTFISDNKFSATAEELSELAEKFNLDLYALLQEGLITYSELLGEYVVDWKNINNLNNGFSQIDNFSENIKDSLKLFFKDFAELVDKGLNGTLTNVESAKLEDWAKMIGLEDQLHFSNTSEGLLLANDLAQKLYNTIGNINGLLDQVMFEPLKNNLIETDDRFKSISSLAAYMADLELKIKNGLTATQLGFLNSLNGNVNVFKRPILNNPDGTISTLLTTTLDSRNYESKIPWVMNISPITPDGKKLTDKELNEYVQQLADEANGNADKMIELDKGALGLIVEIENTDLKNLEDILKSYDERAEYLHEIGAIIEENKENEKFNKEKIELYKKELELATKIKAIRSTSEDSSFKFMENAIPAALNNPLNYYSNWGKAWKILLDSFKSTTDKGLIDYQDFYNMMTEMGNIAALSGVPIEIGAGKFVTDAESAAKYIEEGAAALTVASDGSIKVDLVKFGMTFANSADLMANGIDEGVKLYAKSQIKMLDSMIQMMEVIVAMEDFKKIDLENEGVLDFGELFADVYNVDGVNMTSWQGDAITIVKNLVKLSDTNSELRKGLNNFYINDKSLLLIFKEAEEGVALTEDEAKAYWAAIDALYKAMLSGNYDENDIFKSIMEILNGNNFNGTFKSDNTKLKFSNGMTYEIDDKGNYIYKGKDYGTDQDAVTEAIKNDQLNIYSNIVGTYNEDKQEWTNTAGQDITITSKYNIETNKFEADFSDGTVVESDTPLGLAIAILHYAALKDVLINEALNNPTDVKDEVAEYSITRKGEATINWEVNLKDGETTILGATNAKDGNSALNEFNWQQTRTTIVEFKADTTAFNTDIEESKKEAGKAVDGTINYKTGTIEKLTEEQRTETGFINWETNEIVYPTLDNLNGKIIWSSETEAAGATGNIGLATGNAKAQGTLMGELGPELVVSNGRYFIAGQNGPEMVELADDAIVFNHLQTKSLLEKGMSPGRGRAITNERTAVAFAKGNIHGGPAKASAKAALNALKDLRALWQALLGLSVKDLAGKGGGGGGGGKNDPKAFVKDLEIWYNWLQRIAVLELKITYEQLKRSKILSDMIAHGQDYAKSLMETLDYLRELAVINQSLVNAQQKYFDKRRAEMNSANNPFSALYTFDEYGQLKYKKGALQKLSLISGRNELTGEANYTALQQYSILSLMGYAKYMEYDSSGNKIDKSLDDWYVSAVQAFWDKIDADLKEMQDLHDSIEEHKKAVLEAQEQANLIMHEIEENLISLEDKVLKAIISTREREIEELQKERDAIEEASLNLIDGLSELLNKEKDMYQRQGELDELAKLQRQLSILQRSGGSASQIANLLREINQKLLDMYFETQQAQIDALQQASDNQLLRLDAQIDLMKETLEYEKDNGLLWALVYDVLSGTPEQITAFILEHDDEFWGKSPTTDTKNYREALFEALLFKEYQKLMKDGLDGIVRAFTDDAIKKAAAAEEAKLKALTGGNGNVPTPVGGGTNPTNGGGNGGGNPSDKPKKKVYREKVILTYINTDYGMKISEGIGESSVSAEEAKKNALADARKKAKNLRDTVSTKYTSFSTGGMVDKTGPAIVHAKESVLTAEQTSILRNDILSNKPTSLLSLLTDFRDAYNGISNANYNSITQNDGVTIEQAIVEMHVSRIANDYDAQRAGELALEKMVSIARKTQGQRIGR